MTNDELRLLLTESDPPLTIEIKGGRSYQITQRESVWVPDASQDMICVAIPQRGIVVLRLATIESVRIDHQPITR